MQYRKLGRTGIEVSAICMGGWSIITDDFTWGKQALDDSIAAIHTSLDAGVNFFDTAEGYGNGESEDILAKAIGNRRKSIVIASKVSSANLADGKLQEACEASLRRLKTDYIDLYQIHWPSMELPLAHTLEILQGLQDAGKIRAIGVSNFGPDFLQEAVSGARVEANQLPYSLLWRPIECEIAPLCIQQDISILCYSPLCQGLLTGKFRTADEVPDTRARTRLFSKDRPHVRHAEAGVEKEAFGAIDEIRDLCRQLRLPMSHVSLAWLLGRQGVTSAVCGARNARQARDNAAAADVKLPADAIEHLCRLTEAVKIAMGTNCDPWQSQSRMTRG